MIEVHLIQKTTDWVKTFAGTFESAEAPIMEAVYTNPGINFQQFICS